MSKMFCKLFGHKWGKASYVMVCKCCMKVMWYPKNSGLKPYDKSNKK